MPEKVLLLLLCLWAAGCTPPLVPRDAALEISTSSAAYTRDPGSGVAVVEFVVTNRGSAPVAADRCGSDVVAVLDRREDGRWSQYSADVCPAIYDMSPLVIAPGQAIHGARGITESGRYRIRISARPHSGSAGERMHPSAPFTIE